MKRLVLSTVMLVAACGAAFAQGSIGMGGTLSPSYLLILSQGTSGPTNGGSSTAASIALGTIAYYGTSSASTGVTQSTTGDTHSSDVGHTILSFPVNIEIDKANTSSTTFTLNAALASSAVTGTTVGMGTSTPTILTTAAAALTTTGSYGTGVDYTVTVNANTTVLDAMGPLGQTINLTFTPN
jgi:hypothetical protein